MAYIGKYLALDRLTLQWFLCEAPTGNLQQTVVLISGTQASLTEVDQWFSLTFEESKKRVIDDIFCIHAHDEIGMSIIFDELNRELVSVMKLEAVEQQTHISVVWEWVSTSVANKQRNVARDVCQIIYRRSGFSVMLQIKVRATIVELCDNSISNRCKF